MHSSHHSDLQITTIEVQYFSLTLIFLSDQLLLSSVNKQTITLYLILVTWKIKKQFPIFSLYIPDFNSGVCTTATQEATVGRPGNKIGTLNMAS